MEKIEFLQSLGVARFALDDVRLERQQSYASRMRRRRPSRVWQLSEPRRSIELVCWLRVVLMQLMDVALTLGGMQTTTVERLAREQVSTEDAGLTAVLRDYIVDACAAGFDDTLSDSDARQRMLEILDPGQVPLGSNAARMRLHLSASARRTRPLLRTILKLPLQYEPSEPVGQAIATIKKLYKENAVTLPKEVDVSFAPAWADILCGKDRRQALRGYEAAILQTLKVDVKRGSTWVDDSLNHRSRDSTLMPEEHWTRHNRRLFGSLQIPRDAESQLKPLLANVEVALAAMDKAVKAGDVTIAGGELRLLRRVFAIDVLKCDACGGTMKILAIVPASDAEEALKEARPQPSDVQPQATSPPSITEMN